MKERKVILPKKMKIYASPKIVELAVNQTKSGSNISNKENPHFRPQS